MTKTAYKVTWSPGPIYEVEVTEPDGKRRIVSPFSRQEEAEAWMAEAKWKAAIAASKRDKGGPKKPF